METNDLVLRAATEARAPAVNEFNSSDGASESESEPDGHSLETGSFVLLHGLRKKPELNGAAGFAIEKLANERWMVVVPPSTEISVKPANLQVAAPAEPSSKAEKEAARHVAGLIYDAFLASAETRLFFPPQLSSTSRKVLHETAGEYENLQHGSVNAKAIAKAQGMADREAELDRVAAAAIIAGKLKEQSRSQFQGPRQLIVRKEEAPPLALPPPPAADHLELSLFDEVCRLFEAMEAVQDVDATSGLRVTGALEKRKQLCHRFWRGRAPSSARQRHERPGLFDVFRLLMPHHDTRRYGISVEKLAAWTVEAHGMDAADAPQWGREWYVNDTTGDVALVLEAYVAKRVSREGKPSVTVKTVNDALTAMQLEEKKGHLHSLLLRMGPLEVKWLVRILLRDVKIGSRPGHPVPQKGEYPKVVMDGLCRAQGRVGRPSQGSPPLLYTLLRYRNRLEYVCETAERGELPIAYPPPPMLGVHIRAQLSVACPRLDGAARQLGTSDVFVETKYDGFRFQLHWKSGARQMRCFYRSGVECTNDVQDLLPAVRLAFGGDPAEVLCRSGDAATRKRYTWLEKALARVTDAQREAFVRTDVVLDGELLVYDECETCQGKYDELGTGRGISAFGTIFWLRTRADGSPSRYSRRDARRHYAVKVFDVLRYGDEDVLHRPFHERRALLESGRCFIALPHYLELTNAERVDLSAPERPLESAFKAARDAGEEGLMVKAADKPYAPNARNNVLKVKAEFIEGLGDTLTLLLLGARAPRWLGPAPAPDSKSVADSPKGNRHRLVEFAIGARSTAGISKVAPTAGEEDCVRWLFNSSPLAWQGALGQVDLDRLWRRLTQGPTPLMRRLRADEEPPAWMLDCPTGGTVRPHYVLVDPAAAPLVEVRGSRFLRRYDIDTNASSNKNIPWTLRFPRVMKWCEATDGVVADTVRSFREKAVLAFSHSAPHNTTSCPDDSEEEGEEEFEAEPPLLQPKPLSWQPTPGRTSREPPPSQRPWFQAESRDDGPSAAANSSMPPSASLVGAAGARSGGPGRKRPLIANMYQDWESGDTPSDLDAWAAGQYEGR